MKIISNHQDTKAQKILPSLLSPRKRGSYVGWLQVPAFAGKALASLCLCVLVVQISSAQAHADPVMDRINQSGKIRCGYVSYAPASVKDTVSGKVKGYNVDLVEEAAHRMGLEVEWTYETNWPTMAEDLKTEKFDVACVTYWANAKSSRHMLSTDPIFYQPAFFATRADDHRFDKDISKINNPNTTIAVLEGDSPETIVNELYPDSKRDTLPQSASFAQVFQEVANKRADVTITSKPDMDEFKASNPGKLKIIMDHPVRLYPCVVQLPVNAHQLQTTFNIVIHEMQLDGTVEKIMKEYATGPDDFYMVDLPYSKIKGVK